MIHTLDGRTTLRLLLGQNSLLFTLAEIFDFCRFENGTKWSFLFLETGNENKIAKETSWENTQAGPPPEVLVFDTHFLFANNAPKDLYVNYNVLMFAYLFCIVFVHDTQVLCI